MLGSVARGANAHAKKRMDGIGTAMEDDTETKHTKKNLQVRANKGGHKAGGHKVQVKTKFAGGR